MRKSLVFLCKWPLRNIATVVYAYSNFYLEHFTRYICEKLIKKLKVCWDRSQTSKNFQSRKWVFFCFWGIARSRTYANKLETIPELKFDIQRVMGKKHPHPKKIRKFHEKSIGPLSLFYTLLEYLLWNPIKSHNSLKIKKCFNFKM